MVITLQNVPAEIEEALQRKAAEEGKTLDRVTMDALALGLGVTGIQENNCIQSTSPSQVHGLDKTLEGKPKKVRDLSDIAGRNLISDEMREIFEEQRRIDPTLWK